MPNFSRSARHKTPEICQNRVNRCCRAQCGGDGTLAPEPDKIDTPRPPSDDNEAAVRVSAERGQEAKRDSYIR